MRIPVDDDGGRSAEKEESDIRRGLEARDFYKLTAGNTRGKPQAGLGQRHEHRKTEDADETFHACEASESVFVGQLRMMKASKAHHSESCGRSICCE